MGQFANAGRHLEGAAYLEELRRALRRSARATTRRRNLPAGHRVAARGHANEVPCSSASAGCATRWRMLDEAKRLTHGARCSSRAGCRAWCAHSCPGSSASATRRSTDLQWCLTTRPRPHPGWLREVHFHAGRRPRRARRCGRRRSALAGRAATPADKPPVHLHHAVRRRTRLGPARLRRSDSRGGAGTRSTWCRASSSPSTTSSSRPTGAS